MNHIALLGILFLLVFGCSEKKTSGTDTGNPIIVATVVDSSGSAKPWSRISVYRSGGFIAEFSADGIGVASIEVPDTGLYFLEAITPDSSSGVFQGVVVPDTGVKATLSTGALVPFTTGSLTTEALITETGRTVLPGQSVLLPPGMIGVRYTDYFIGGKIDTTISLPVDIGSVGSNSSALQGLHTAAWKMDSLGIPIGDFAQLSPFPTYPVTVAKLDWTCIESGFASVQNACATEGSCWVWQWDQEITSLDGIAMLADAIVGNGEFLCLFFSDAELESSNYFYTVQDVVPP